MSEQARRPRLAVVIPTLGCGGAEKVTTDIVGVLRKDWDVRVFLTKAENDDGTYAPTVEAMGIPVVRLPSYRRFSTLRKTWPLRRAILEMAPDAVLSVLTATNAVVSFALRGTRFPIVLNEHNNLRVAFRERMKHPRIFSFLTGLAYRSRRTKASIVVSQAVVDMIREDYPKATADLVVVHNGLDVGILERAAKEPLDDFPVPAGTPTVVAVGRLQPVKNFPLLLRALAHGGELCRGAHLLLLGKGDQEGELRACADSLGISDRVHFLGFRKNPHAWVARADVFAMSSDSEGFPCALAEAMFTNGHCVSTDCPAGPSEIIEDGKSGLLVPVGDEKALAAALERMLSDGELRERCARNARAWAAENTIEHQARAYDAVLRAAAGLAPAAP